MTKWVVVTGGVVSGIGKGTATAAIGRLLKNSNKIVTIKCDGYLNIDPGTMNPIEHGEVFVLDDGGEVDMDFGHYERFLEIQCKFDWNLTSGKIFDSIIRKEREGQYLGKTIQIFPHLPKEIKGRFYKIAKEEQADIVMIEIGGTIGDIENSWFVEAVRQLKREVKDIVYVHLTYVPYLNSVGEPKTKPAQRDLALVHEKGIYPDIIIARSKELLSKKLKEKLALFCDVEPNQIVSGRDIETIYELPIMFKNEGMFELLKEKLNLTHEPDLKEWENLVNNIKNPKKQIDVAICGKYTELRDSYVSILESLIHAGAHLDAKINLRWVETTDIEDRKISAGEALKGIQGIIVPGGFGSRGVEGKMQVIKYARENNIPYLGLCLGLQLAVVEFARNVCNLKAHTTEIDSDTEHPIIDILPEQKQITKKGGTMRLGAYTAKLKHNSLVYSLYKQELVSERHRHRYEVNPDYHEVLEKNGLIISGSSENGKLAEFIEYSKNKFHVATQAHPELKSKFLHPAPLFYGFVKACIE